MVRAQDPDGSWEGALLQTKSKVDLVKVALRSLLATNGPCTDEILVDRYEAYCFMNPSMPKVTPQSIRTRRAALVYEGLVIDTGRRGRTRLGNTATIWASRPNKENDPVASSIAPGPMSATPD